MMRCRRHRKKKTGAGIALLLLLALTIALVVYSMARIQRIFMEYAVNLCEDSAIQEINNLMEEEVFSNPAACQDMVVLEHDTENRVTALRTNIFAIGRMKSRLVNGLFERLGDLEHTTVEVPLGTVFAPHFLTGKGPSLDIGMAGMGQMSAEFVSAFSSAGINQTRHNIIIEIHAGFRILTPLGGKDIEIVTNYPVTDTVIIGTVPEQYMYIDEMHSGLLGSIHDDNASSNSVKIVK